MIAGMRKTQRSERITFRLPQPLRDELAAQAQENGRPLADYIRRLLAAIAACRWAEREGGAPS
jgi:hypothetical protein